MIFGALKKNANFKNAVQERWLERSLEKVWHLKTVVRGKEANQLLDYYLSVHPKDKLPGRELFDPMAIPSILPNIVLVDVCRSPYRFKFRVVGNEICENWNSNPVGQYFDEFVGGIENKYAHIDRVAVVEKKDPIYRYSLPDVEFRTSFAKMESLHLPLASDGENVDMIVSTIVYQMDDMG